MDTQTLLEELQASMKPKVRANAESESGLSPVAFLLRGADVIPTVVTGKPAGSLQGPMEAIDRVCRQVQPDAALVAIQAEVRDIEPVGVFREVVEEGGIVPPSQASDSYAAVFWMRFTPGMMTLETDPFRPTSDGFVWDDLPVRTLPDQEPLLEHFRG